MARPHLLAVLGAMVAIALAASAVAPHDRLTWFMEVLPVLIAAPVLVATGRRFPLTTLLYVLITVHALVLILGAEYTYARVPLGNWIQDAFDLDRNPYDKIGHFMQGLVPALVAREILVRFDYVSTRRMTGFLCICVALAVSALYELIEWWAALFMGQDAAEFLGTQGDPWDAQQDMFFAGIGALVAVLVLARWQDRQIERVRAGMSPR
jgi:putative membrane protein